MLPYESAQLQGWGAALVLIFIILGINLGVRTLVLHKKETMQILKTLKEKVGGKN